MHAEKPTLGLLGSTKQNCQQHGRGFVFYLVLSFNSRVKGFAQSLARCYAMLCASLAAASLAVVCPLPVAG